jgi:hypothetical protein
MIEHAAIATATATATPRSQRPRHDDRSGRGALHGCSRETAVATLFKPFSRLGKHPNEAWTRHGDVMTCGQRAAAVLRCCCRLEQMAVSQGTHPKEAWTWAMRYCSKALQEVWTWVWLGTADPGGGNARMSASDSDRLGARRELVGPGKLRCLGRKGQTADSVQSRVRT